VARTPLLRSLQQQMYKHVQACAHHGPGAGGAGNPPVGDGAAQAGRSVFSRRRFLAGTAAAAGGLALSRLGSASPPAPQPSIAIVGAGLAGLSAALTLADAGYVATIYETSQNRVGGRTQTDRGSAQNILEGGSCGVCHESRPSGDTGYWVDGHCTDIFGEMIDTAHTTMRSLAKRFGLAVVDSLAAEPAGSTPTYHFFNSYYPKSQADADFKILSNALQKDLVSAGYPTTYQKSTPAGRVLDATSIYEWIESRVPGGHASPLGRVLDVAYAIEFGADTTDQSALSLIYLLGYGSKTQFSEFGSSDERYRIRGGTWEVSRAIAQYLRWDASIKFGHWLEAISRSSDGRYVLSFDKDGGGRATAIADIVLLAIPFAVLRTLNYSSAGFDTLKQRAIQDLGRGKNGKLQLQFTRRYWNQRGPWGIGTGTAYSDTGFQNTWEPSRGFPGTSGILVKYTGGSPVDLLSLNHPYGDSSSPKVLRDAQAFLTELEPVFPGISLCWNGKAAGSMAHFDPRFLCSYSYWRVGQYTTIAGYEGQPQGNVFFAGEHTSLDFQGWMEGAARSGVAAGNAIISRIRGLR